MRNGLIYSPSSSCRRLYNTDAMKSTGKIENDCDILKLNYN